MKHIDGDALAKRFEDKIAEMETPIGKAVFGAIARAIEETPESVVRCKDCAHRGWEMKCPLEDRMEDDFFCSWGEREEDEID